MTHLSAFRSESCKARYLAKYDEVLKTWPVPYRERDVSTRFGTTHLIESGAEDLPPLLLFHGASTTAVLWQPLIAQLSRHYRCFAIDTIFDPNKSELAAPLSGNDDVVAWMKDILAALGIQKTRVAGLSFGGWLASLLVLHCPEQVSHAVWMAPGGTIGALSMGFWLRLLPAALLRSSVQMRKSLRSMTARKESLNHPTMDLIALGPELTLLRRPCLVFPNVFTEDELRRCRIPITVLLGDQEVIYRKGPVAVSDRAKKLIPDVRVHILKNTGHMMTLDAPDEVVAHMLSGLSR